jgi:hypothetical protein
VGLGLPVSVDRINGLGQNLITWYKNLLKLQQIPTESERARAKNSINCCDMAKTRGTTFGMRRESLWLIQYSVMVSWCTKDTAEGRK